MDQPRVSTETEGRRDPRIPMDQAVSIDFEVASIVGSGQNVSRQGVFFTTEAAVPVTVRIVGSSEVRRGELVRIESMGGGRIGVAVRFLEPQADPAS